MIYTDKEQLDWWKSLGKSDQKELIETMVSVTDSDFANSILDQFLVGKPMSPKQIAAIRKWDR